MVRIFDEAAVEQAVDYESAIAALRSTLMTDFDPADDAARLSAPLSHGQFLFMPAEIGDHVSVKILTVTPDNPAAGLARVQGTCLLLDARTHRTLASIDGTALTNLRTPAMSLAGVADVLTDRFPDGVRMTVFGVGPQGFRHVEAARAVVPVRDVAVVVREAGRGADFLAELAAIGVPGREVVGRSGTEPVPAALAEALAASDLVVTATTAAEPLFDADAIAADAVVVALGSHSPDARELPGELLGRATVIVESMHSAAAECGDVVLAIRDGHMALSDALTVKDVVRRRGAQITSGEPVVFKTSGMSWEDLAVARAVYEAVGR